MPSPIKTNTALTIHYCDANNNNFQYPIILKGVITNELLDGYMATCREGIIPKQIHETLEHPFIRSEHCFYSGPDPDHIWCTIQELDECDPIDLNSMHTVDEANVSLTVSEFFNKIKEIESNDGWDYKKEWDRYFEWAFSIIKP